MNSQRYLGFFWIGLKGQVATNQFVWVESSSVLDYSNWAEGFPGTTDGLDCVRMRHFDFKWESFNCSAELNYLCEDPYHRKTYVVTEDTKIKGLMLGFGLMGGLILMCCLILQHPCCRVRVSETVSSLRLRTKNQDKKENEVLT